jgi:hypothetical protein
MKNKIVVSLFFALGLLLGWGIQLKADGGIGFSLIIQNAGTAQGGAVILNCDGSSVLCTYTGGKVTLSATAGAGGITTLTGDGSAGPGSGSQVLTNTGMNGAAVPTSSTVSGTNAMGQFVSQTATTVTAFLNLFTSSLQGLVPASGGGTLNFLRADGTWAAPPGGCTVVGMYLTCGGNQYGPVYPISSPPTAASWTNAGAVSTLSNITGGGLSFTSTATSTPSGWTIPAAGSTSTFTIQYSNVTVGGGLGMFCTSTGGSSQLFHWAASGTSLSVSNWTAMNTTTPGFINAPFSGTVATFPLIFRMQATGSALNFYYSPAQGMPFVLAYTTASVAAFTICGVEGYGTGSAASSATVVSVTNTTP